MPITISHCECDKILKECLSNSTEKEQSKEVDKLYFNTLNNKCFAFIPCEKNDKIDKNNYIVKLFSSYGECKNGIRVKVFKKTDLYDEFVRTQLDEKQRDKIVKVLSEPEKIMHEKKLNSSCRKHFKYLDAMIYDRFVDTISFNKDLKENAVRSSVIKNVRASEADLNGTKTTFVEKMKNFFTNIGASAKGFFK